MNIQPKKILAISAVVFLHVAVITLMLAQHGCKSDGAKASAPAPATPAPLPAPVAADNNFVAPTRPAPVVPAAPIPVGQFSEPLGSAPVPVVSAPTPAPSAPPVTWVVAKGDKLATIAKKNGITVDELVAANAPKVSKTTPLKIGQTLIVPNSGTSSQLAPAAAESVPAGGSVYAVQSGDSLSKIAKKNGTTIAAIKSLNKLTSDTVRIGQKLNLPAATAKSSAASAASAPASVDASGGEYTVEAGDTLSKIAVKTGVKLKDLMSANNLTAAAARNLHPGQKLQLPANGHAPDASAPATPVEVTPISSLPTTLGAPSNVTGVPAAATTTAPITPVQ